MTRLIVSPTQPLLTFFCLTVVLQTSQVQSYRKTVKCVTAKFSAGEIITVSVYDNSWFCGSSTGRYFAVWDNVLFHLFCASGSKSPTQAQVLMLDMNDQQTCYDTFDEEMMCDVQSPDGVSTGEASYQIVNRLRGSYVPYDKSKCNSQHYVDYLAYGSASGAKDSCPVFAFISAYTSIDRNFKFLGKNGQSFDWPAEGAMMMPPAKPPPAPKKRPASPTKSSWNPISRIKRGNSSSSSPQQAVRRSPRHLAGTGKVVDRKGSGGGGGGHSRGGHSFGGRGGGGSRGGGEETHGGSGVNPAVVAGAAGGYHGRQSSGAARKSPLPFSLPKWVKKGKSR